MITALFVWCLARNLIPAGALWGSVVADLLIFGMIYDLLSKIITRGKK